jgi:hypothetical protein
MKPIEKKRLTIPVEPVATVSGWLVDVLDTAVVLDLTG